jgi:Protein of unknown function (DUF3551)
MRWQRLLLVGQWKSGRDSKAEATAMERSATRAAPTLGGHRLDCPGRGAMVERLPWIAIAKFPGAATVDQTVGRPATKALLLAAALFVTGAMSTGAAAQSYSWCAYFTGGPVTCEFTTLEQCMQAIRGKTALCNQNSPTAPTGHTPPKPVRRTKSASAPPAGAEATSGDQGPDTPRRSIISRRPR